MDSKKAINRIMNLKRPLGGLPRWFDLNAYCKRAFPHKGVLGEGDTGE